jgi:hypothetical protein
MNPRAEFYNKCKAIRDKSELERFKTDLVRLVLEAVDSGTVTPEQMLEALWEVHQEIFPVVHPVPEPLQ